MLRTKVENCIIFRHQRNVVVNPAFVVQCLPTLGS